MNYTNKNPWMWGVYVVAIGLPVVLIFSFCCGSSQVFLLDFRKLVINSFQLGANIFLWTFKEKQEQAKAAKAKKTDDVVEDDEVPEEEDGAAAAQENDEDVPPLEGDDDEEEEEEDGQPEVEEVPEAEEVTNLLFCFSIST